MSSHAETLRAIIRARGQRASAYVLGAEARQTGANIEINPYTPGSRGYHSFIRGFFAADKRIAGGAA